jgi:hypothetical protein
MRHCIPAATEWRRETALYEDEAIHQTPVGQGAGNLVLLLGHHQLQGRGSQGGDAELGTQLTTLSRGSSGVEVGPQERGGEVVEAATGSGELLTDVVVAEGHAEERRHRLESAQAWSDWKSAAGSLRWIHLMTRVCGVCGGDGAEVDADERVEVCERVRSDGT